MGATRLTRADLAAALYDLARGDRSVARVLTACEAWEAGYVAGLLTRAEEMSAQDAVVLFDSPRERALHAIDRAIRQDNPFLRVRQAGVEPSGDAIGAILEFLHQQARFHDVAGDLERRAALRIDPPAEVVVRGPADVADVSERTPTSGS